MSPPESVPPDSSPERAPELPDRHTAVSEMANGNEKHDAFLELRATILEDILQRETPSPLVLDTLQYVQKRLGDTQDVSDKDRIRIPRHFADAAANERVRELVQELQGSAGERPVPL